MKQSLLFTIILFFSVFFKASGQETLSLFDAIQLALQNNYSITIMQNNAVIASNNNTPGNAGMLPVLDLDAAQNNTFSTTYQKTFAGTERDIKGARNHLFNAGIALNWTVFDGFSMFAGKDMLAVLEGMGEKEARLAVENTVSMVILNYYGIVQEKKVLQVLRDAAALSFERKKVADAKISLGAGSRLMLLQSTVDLNADSTRIIQEMAVLKNIEAELNRLMGRDPALAFEVTDTLSLESPLSYQDLVARAATQNTELMLARSNQDLSVLELRNQRSKRYPWLDLNAGYNYNQLQAQTGYLEYNRSYGPSIGLTLSYNLFDGFNTNREIKNARINISNAEFHFKDVDLGVRSEIYQLYNDYLSNLEVVRLELVNQQVAKENVDVALEKYRLGTISDIELREIQKKLIDAQYQLFLAEFRAKQAEIGLLRISGDLYQVIENGEWRTRNGE